MDLAAEIGDLIEGIETKKEEVIEEKKEEIVEEKVEEKKEDVKETVEEKKEEIVEDKKEEKKEEIVVDELTTLKTQNELLLKRIDELAGNTLDTKKEEVVEVKEDVIDDGEIKFITDDADLNNLLDDREKLNKILNTVYNAGKEFYKKNAPKMREGILKELPKTVLAQVQQQSYMLETTREFFKNNPKLTSVRKALGIVANEVAAEHSDWSLEQVLEETGNRGYTLLGIKKEVIKQEEKEEPSFAGGSSSRKKSADLRSSLEKDIDSLIG